MSETMTDLSSEQSSGIDLQKVLKAIAVVNRRAKHYKQRHESETGSDFDFFKQKALYRAKETAVMEIWDEAVALEQQQMGGRPTYCADFTDGTGNRWSFHVPVDQVEGRDVPLKQRFTDPHTKNPEVEFTEVEAVQVLFKQLDININEHLRVSQVWVNGGRRDLRWFELPVEDDDDGSDSGGGE